MSLEGRSRSWSRAASSNAADGGGAAKIVWFWCLREVGQSSAEVLDLQTLTDAAGRRDSGSPADQRPRTPRCRRPLRRPAQEPHVLWHGKRDDADRPLGSRASELLDATVALVCDVDVPVPVGRHAEGAVELAVARVAETPPRGEEGAGGGELLDAVVSIEDGDGPAPVGRHAGGGAELSGARAVSPPRGEEGAARVELLDAVVVRIRDVDVPVPVGRHAEGVVELAVARVAETPPRGEESAGAGELLDAVVVRIRDVDVPVPVGRHAQGGVELTVARAAAAPRGDEGSTDWHRRGGRARR